MQAIQYLRVFFMTVLGLGLLGAVVLLPYARWWVGASGDMAVEEAVERQAAGEFVMFGSGMSQDFVDYKLRLYAAQKPAIVTLGSSRVMQFRSRYMLKPYTNVGGTAGNISVLRSTVDAMLKAHTPEAIIIGLDFWWFTTAWHPDAFKEEPPTSGSYNYGFNTLKTPWTWLLTGKISAAEFFAPLTGGFRDNRLGIMAQRFDDGFAPDGSWYYTADVTGRQHPFDYQFHDTLMQVQYGIKAFAPAPRLSEDHVTALAEIVCRLQSRGVKTYLFIAPLSERVLAAMREKREQYPQLFGLKEALQRRGLEVMDFTDPRTLNSSDCEFVDGFHGGDVAYARVLRALADRNQSLLPYVNMQALDDDIRDYSGNVMVPDPRITSLPEVDFMHFSCPKRNVR